MNEKFLVFNLTLSQRILEDDSDLILILSVDFRTNCDQYQMNSLLYVCCKLGVAFVSVLQWIVMSSKLEQTILSSFLRMRIMRLRELPTN